MDEIVVSTSPSEFARLMRIMYLAWGFLQIKPNRTKTVQSLLQSVVTDIQYINDLKRGIQNMTQPHVRTTFLQFKRSYIVTVRMNALFPFMLNNCM